MATITFTPSQSPRYGFARPVEVLKLVRDELTGLSYESIPSVLPMQVELCDGAEPGTARLRYVFTDEALAPYQAPARWDEVYPLESSGKAVVKNDTEIVIREYDPDDKPRVVFHGFTQIPQVDIGPRQQEVSFQALGVAVRGWDAPIKGAIYRDADEPVAINDTETELPVRFNPNGKGNATIDDQPSGDAPWEHSVFIDPLVSRDPVVTQLWTVANALKYLLATANPQVDEAGDAIDPLWVVNPDFAQIDGVFESRVPKDGAVGFDPADPATYDTLSLICGDVDVTGKSLWEAVDMLITPHGYGMTFYTEEDEDGFPFTYLEIYRKDDNGEAAVKDMLYPDGGNLDPASANLGGAHLARDASGLANQFSILTALKRYEASFILAPGFEVAAGDLANIKNFTSNAAGFEDVKDKYRLFVFDETGEGHWDFVANAMSYTPPSLRPIFYSRGYAIRRRPPQPGLLSQPEGIKIQGQPKLEIIRAGLYLGERPGVWTAEAESPWQNVTQGWRLTRDRLGIYINVLNPENDFSVGADKTAGASYPDGKVRIMTSLAAPTSLSGANPLFLFRLTCVIEGDYGLDVLAERRAVSPTKFTVERVDETRDRFKVDTITRHSALAEDNSVDVIKRDDREAAKAHADARRLSHELGPTAGSITIPRLTDAYRVADRIRAIRGRQPDVKLNSGLGNNLGESPVYPSVVKLVRSYGSTQSVTLHLSDRRAEPPRKRIT